MKQLGREQVGLGGEFDLLCPIDRGEGLLGRVDVEGAEKLATRGVGDGAELAFVEVGNHAAGAEPPAGVVEDRHRHESVPPGTDGVDRQAARLGNLGGLLGGEHAAVVGAIGHEDDERALALAALLALGLLEAGEGHAQTVADGGAVLDHAELEALDLAAQPLVVEGQRGERVGAAREDDHADAVTGALTDEGLDDGLDGLQAVDAFAAALVVLGEH